MAKGKGPLYLIAVAGLVLAMLPYAAQADDASLGAVGYGVVPLDNDQVTMAAERVDAEIRGDRAWVTCVFTFTNTGPPTEVLMGFPQADSTRGESELVDFRAFVDEVEIPVAFRHDTQTQARSEYPVAGWHTFTVAFAPGQTHIVRNTYHGRLTRVSNGGRIFEYILHTGATWKGPIGQADIVVRWQRDRDVAPESLSAHPTGYAKGRRELRWHFSNFEPSREDDIGVHFRPVYGPHNLGIDPSFWGQVPPSRSEPGRPPEPLIADNDPATAWISPEEVPSGDLAEPWVAWSYGTFPHYSTETLGLGILPGVAGDEDAFRAHGRPKEVLVRLARLREGAETMPAITPVPPFFLLSPEPELELTEHRLVLEDAPHWQFLRLEKPATVLAFQVVVETVYPGESHHDVAIAELLFPLLEEDLESVPVLLPFTGEGSQVGFGPWVTAPAAMVLASLTLFWLRKRDR